MIRFPPFHAHKRAASLTGYGLIVGLIAIAAIAALQGVGTQITTLFGAVGEQMESASAAGGIGSGGGDPEASEENQAPSAPQLSSASLVENNAIGYVIGTLSALDPEDDDVSFALLNSGDYSFFRIGGVDGNELQAFFVFDFEDPQDSNADNLYEVSITATDNGSPPKTSQNSFSIEVVNDPTDEAPTGCPNIGDRCSDGSFYAGLGSDGGVPLYVMACDAGIWMGGLGDDENACTGSRINIAWNDGTTDSNFFIDTELDNVSCSGCGSSGGGGVFTDQGSAQMWDAAASGRQNTALLVNLDSTSKPGIDPHLAAEYCDNLQALGRSDWYLPAIRELNNLWQTKGNNSAYDNTFATSSPWYWSSSEIATGQIWSQRFTDGTQDWHGLQHPPLFLRCVRR